jgi:hypothetical protein
MAEVGIEIATEQPKILTADAVKASDVVIIASTGIHAVIRKCDLWIRSRLAGAYHSNFCATTAEANVGRGAVVGIVGLQEPVVGVCDHANSVASIL